MRFSFLLLAAGILCASTVRAEEITERDLLGHIQVLASDLFEGRKPGTIGENKTVNYIAKQWMEAGLLPAGDQSSWYAKVGLIDRIPGTQNVHFEYDKNGRGKKMSLAEDDIRLRGRKAESQLTRTAMVHTGYGLGKIDELRPHVAGKLAFLFLTSPIGRKDFPSYRERKGKLIAAGAAGVISVVKGKARWKRTLRRFGSASILLDDDNMHAPVEGVISVQAFERLLRKTGTESDFPLTEIEETSFRPFDIPAFAHMTLETRIRTYDSHNVVGKISGRNPEKGALLYLGHWDHFGECEPESLTDRICNGAVDNASGISLLIETAKRLSKIPLDRDVYFLATTAEERGLLGARAFVKRPSFSLSRLTVVFNADTVAVAPDGDLIAVVGRGETALDPDIEKVAAAERRTIDETDKANAYLKRQDGYVFLEKGIPAFMISSAFADQQRLDAYILGRYHGVNDEVDEELELGGAVDDANFHVALGRYFGNIATYPQKPTSELDNN